MAYILIADDDELVASVASEAMIGAGHACGWVTDGEQALDLLKWRRPDLMLLDQRMPGISGAEVLRKLRTSSDLYDLPVIMFTAMTGTEDEEQARYYGAQDYIRKPFDARALVRRVNYLLKTRNERPKHQDLQTFLAQKSGTWREEMPKTRSIV